MLNDVQHVKNVSGNKFFFLPREIGGIQLTKTTSWEISSFFVTLSSLSNNMSLPLSKFTNITSKTANAIQALESELQIPLGEAFYSELDSEKKKIWKQILSLYEGDSNIKRHHEPPSWIKKFMKVFEKSLVIVKGSGDTDALKNLCILKGYEYTKPQKIIDIANWNPESTRLCQSAKLQDTYICIENKLSTELRKINEKLPIKEEHDPTTDAAMTLVIALYITEYKNT